MEKDDAQEEQKLDASAEVRGAQKNKNKNTRNKRNK